MTARVSRRTVLQTGAAAAVVTGLPLPIATADAEARRGAGPLPPTLDFCAGDWMSVPDLLNRAAVTNDRGALKCGQNVSSFELATFAPLSQGGETLQLTVDGENVPAQQSRWFPYQVARRGDVGGFAVETLTRMPSGQDTVLVRIKVRNTTAKSRRVSLALTTSTWLRTFAQKWDWQLPRPNDATPYRPAQTGRGTNLAVTVSDSESSAVAAHAFSRVPDAVQLRATDAVVTWRPTIAAGGSVTVGVVVAAGTRTTSATNVAVRLARRFDSALAQVQLQAEKRFRAAFTPGNQTYSGHLPMLVTDDRRLRRLYFTSIASVLRLERSNFAAGPRVFPTAAPEWADTLTYFWDTSLWASVWALLDPAMMREQLPQWLALGITDGYAVDNLTGTLSGPWYSANDLSMFTLLRYYVDHTGDVDFLSERVGDRAILAHMDAIATHWQSLVPPGGQLADYGGAENLLEAVPTYIHTLAALSAGT